MQTVKSKLNKYVKVENLTDLLGSDNITVTFGPDRGEGYNITKNVKFEF